MDLQRPHHNHYFCIFNRDEDVLTTDTDEALRPQFAHPQTPSKLFSEKYSQSYFSSIQLHTIPLLSVVDNTCFNRSRHNSRLRLPRTVQPVAAVTCNTATHLEEQIPLTVRSSRTAVDIFLDKRVVSLYVVFTSSNLLHLRLPSPLV